MKSARGKIVSLYIPNSSSGTYILPLSPITGSHTAKRYVTFYPLSYTQKQSVDFKSVGSMELEAGF
jgi:hypothetical protein